MTTTYKLKVDSITIIAVIFILALAITAIVSSVSGKDEIKDNNEYLRERLTECINKSPGYAAEKMFDDAGEEL